ncbi:GNAT family N-acetyltransferase [Nocardiopsis prasina]|uniref:GNAT family N-acetyltransferase n=1 Tax=Nocardiopsis prasina TaxID=2015 RepID=UPI00034D1A08|nr:GNAT family N-acetyltransferase [Nocardiopsis prasina]
MIGRIDPYDAHAFDSWYEAYRVAWLDGRETGGVIPREALRGAVTAERDDAAHQLHAVWEGDRIVGTLMLELSLKENTEYADVCVTVVPDRRGRGLGARLLAEAERRMAELGRTVAVAEVPVPSGWSRRSWPGSRFALGHGFTVGLEEDSLLLDLPVAPELLARLRPDVGDYRMREWTGACPDDLVEAYADLCTVMQRDMPSGDMSYVPEVWDVERVRALEARRARAGTVALVTVAQAPSGELAGFTVLSLVAGEDVVGQEDTLVTGAHRGRRLGRALKVHNLERLVRDFPDRPAVRTWNAVGNGYMRDINVALGFRVEERHLELERRAGVTGA